MRVCGIAAGTGTRPCGAGGEFELEDIGGRIDLLSVSRVP